MKRFETPEMEVKKYEIADIIAASNSGEGVGGDGNVGGEIWD